MGNKPSPPTTMVHVKPSVVEHKSSLIEPKDKGVLNLLLGKKQYQLETCVPKLRIAYNKLCLNKTIITLEHWMHFLQPVPSSFEMVHRSQSHDLLYRHYLEYWISLVMMDPSSTKCLEWEDFLQVLLLCRADDHDLLRFAFNSFVDSKDTSMIQWATVALYIHPEDKRRLPTTSGSAITFTEWSEFFKNEDFALYLLPIWNLQLHLQLATLTPHLWQHLSQTLP